MNSVFISYSKSRSQRASLFYALREHGVNPWRDVERLELGSDTSETIERELDRCSSVILWINHDILASAYVREVELPAVMAAKLRRGIRIVPIFDGLSPRHGADEVAKLGYEIGENYGHTVDPSADDETNARAIARRYLEGHIADARCAGQTPIVRLISYDDTADFRDEAVLNLDWRHALEDDRLTESAEARLRSALGAATAALKAAYGACEITLALKTHLPFAVAIGHAFAEPTGCRLRMVRGGDVWATSRSVPCSHVLRRELRPQAPAGARLASVEVSVTRDVSAGVTQAVAGGRRYRHGIVLTPQDGPNRSSVDSPDTGLSWAHDIASAITTLSDRGDVDQVDLYLATPIELAATVGWWTNAAGTIELMNWTAKTGPYCRLWTLP